MDSWTHVENTSSFFFNLTGRVEIALIQAFLFICRIYKLAIEREKGVKEKGNGGIKSKQSYGRQKKKT